LTQFAYQSSTSPVDLHRALHRLLDHLDVAAELFALDEINLQLAGGLVVDASREAQVLPIEDRPERVGAAEGQRGLGLGAASQRRQCSQQGRSQKKCRHVLVSS
jgi:hypothetical protein